jgi:hypothetical protein
MNYEIFIWLEPVAIACAWIFAILGFAFTIMCIAYFCVSKNEEEKSLAYGENNGYTKTAAYYKKQSKTVLPLSIIFLALFLLVLPVSRFTDIYKTTLIYRGINSTLVDKGVDTADKALDVLNAKLDKEMTAIKAEKE